MKISERCERYFAKITLLIVLLLSSSLSNAATAVDVQCLGWSLNEAIVGWQDAQPDIAEYIVEKQESGGGFVAIATLGANVRSYTDAALDGTIVNEYRVVAVDTTGGRATSAFCRSPEFVESDNFRVFFKIAGVHACPNFDGQVTCLTNVPLPDGTGNIYAQDTLDVLEGSLAAFARVGFPDAKVYLKPAGLDKIPVNIAWCDGGGCQGGGALALSPLVLENDFAITGDPIASVVALHELFHYLQMTYVGINDPSVTWALEGQARSVQDKFCIGDDRSTCTAYDHIDTGTFGYVPEIGSYMRVASNAINALDYRAVLFWTYLTEKFGSTPTGETVEVGVDFIAKFWEMTETYPNRDGIHAVNQALSELGFSETFESVWKDFSVANYAKNLTPGTLPAKYRYSDMQEPGGTYPAISFSLDQSVNLGDQIVRSGEAIAQWGARYYRIRPNALVNTIDIKVNQDSTGPLYFTVLGVQSNNYVFEQNFEARNLDYTLANNGYDEVVLVVSALDRRGNYRLSINGADPVLNIVRPTFGNAAAVGDALAPEKFLLIAELLAPDGTPLPNVNLADFSFTVDGVPIAAENIITSAPVQGQQWFVLRAPVQPVNGTYPLTVNYSTGLSETEAAAISYVPRLASDSIITLDRSGSMSYSLKMESAKEAAKLYVDSWRSGDQIGLVTFNHIIDPAFALSPWTSNGVDGTREQIHAAIDAVSADGNTALGDAAEASRAQLAAAGDATHDWSIVLLSDGIQTAGSATLDSVVTAISEMTQKPVIHAVAVGPDADQQLLQRAAASTGGSYQYISAPADPDSPSASGDYGDLGGSGSMQLEMDKRYRVVSSKIDEVQQVFSTYGPQADGDPDNDTVTIPIEANASELIVTLSFESPVSADISLELDSGNVMPVHKVTDRTRVWRIAAPWSGDWQLHISKPVTPTPTPIPTPIITFVGKIEALLAAGLKWFVADVQAQSYEYLPPYLVQVSLRSEVRMDHYFPLPVEERISAVGMPINVSLTDTGPVTGAMVAATVRDPAGQETALTLFDDGLHADGAANDGIYGAMFYGTQQPGSYNVDFAVSGVSSLIGSFTREDVSAFFIYGGGDKDGDGLPNSWEEANGTDPATSDAWQDPDGDGVNNQEEWQQGTDPLNPDSDGGGEQDGTDPDPLDPNDDKRPSAVQAYPQDGQVVVVYVIQDGTTEVEILRAPDPEGPFVIIDYLYPGDGTFIDEDVDNNQPYCYMAVLVDANGRRSVPINPSCVTPKQDAFPPHGMVSINDSQPLTVSTEVRLQLWASDFVSPENLHPSQQLLYPSDAPASGVVDMMISNAPDFDGADWEPYSAEKNWVIAPLANGLATVFVKYRDAYNNESAVVSDSIYLVTLDLTQCAANPMGIATSFNYFVFGDGSQNGSQIEGRVAFGGNGQFINHQTGSHLTAQQQNEDTIVVGGNISYQQGIVHNGNFVYAGTAATQQMQVLNGEFKRAYPILFPRHERELRLLSEVWGSMAANGQSTIQYWGGPSAQITLAGSEPQLNIFTLSAQDLGAANSLNINAPAGSTVIINVPGNFVQMRAFGFSLNGVDAQHVVFNLYQAEDLLIRDVQIKGSVLAPLADAEIKYGEIAGTAIAKSLVGTSSRALNQLFDGCLPLPQMPQ